MRVVFMGTPEFAVPALSRLIQAGHDVVAVYTRAPQPKGRGHQVQKSPVHAIADSHAIPVYTPKSLRRDPAAVAAFRAHAADVAIVAAYGLLLPPDVLSGTKHGCLNLHASLLPRWRGASPVHRAVWAGDPETGVTLMQMDQGLDTGAMIEKTVVPITPQSTTLSLLPQLADAGAELMIRVLTRLERDGRLTAEPQDDQKSTLAPLLTKQDGKIDWTKSAVDIDRQVRALAPWPGTFFDHAGKRFKLIAGSPMDDTTSAQPGTVLSADGLIAAGGGTRYRLAQIQPDGGKPMPPESAVNGGYWSVDDILS